MEAFAKRCCNLPDCFGGWALDRILQVLWAGNSFTQILPTVGVLVGISVGVMAIAVWRFNRSKLFE